MTDETTRDYVIRMLTHHDRVCGTTFWDDHHPSGRNRVSELRAEGWTIKTEPCDDPYHSHRPRSHIIQYRLIDTPELTLDLGGTT